MTWNLSEKDYPQIEISSNHEKGLAKWLEKIIELAPNYEGQWNVLVADLWPNDNYSRLIGHVQMNNVAIGYDTGFRVCAYLENGGIEGDAGDDIPLIHEWLESAATEIKTNEQLCALNKKNAFEIRLSSWGDGPISETIRIDF